MSVPIWKRLFVRSSARDDDEIADDQFRSTNFVDDFGKFLQLGENAKLRTFDEVVTKFWEQSKAPQPSWTLSIFVIADGAFIDQSKIPGNWFNSHLRLVAAIEPSPSTGSSVFIVGPLNVKKVGGFLQVASWDTKCLRFYAVEQINGGETGWTYQGSSFEAFTDNASPDFSYLGPFNGHVNGAAIMKELHRPWYHWYTGGNLESFLKCISPANRAILESIPYITGTGQVCLTGANVSSAENLEGNYVKSLVTGWYDTRLAADFCDAASPEDGRKPKLQPSNINRWMAHLLLTTTVNFITSQTDGQTFTAPLDHFFNFELLQSNYSDLLPDEIPTFQFDINMYKDARKALRLSLLQEFEEKDLPPQMPFLRLPRGTLGGGKETDAYDLTYFVEVLPFNEGIPFVALQTSYEDAQGVVSMQNLSSFGSRFPSGLLSDKAIKAILVLDFWNPVYSWRRGVLMQYLPQTTTYSQTKTYDLEANLIAAIRQSSHVINKDVDSPEYNFIQLYDTGDTKSYLAKTKAYLHVVDKRLQTPEGLLDYLSLAESRRRIFRPVPLDEFGFQLPYAVYLPAEWEKIEMLESGLTAKIPQRGLDFFEAWMTSLHGFDPHLLPHQGGTLQLHKLARSLQGLPSPNASHCPVSGRTDRSFRLPLAQDKGQHPTWNDDVAKLFSNPYWIPDGARVGSQWISQMQAFSPPAPEDLHLDLSDRISVAKNAVTIYQHLRSKSMPITGNPDHYWPDPALETFRVWANEGFRVSASDPFQPKEVIPAPTGPAVVMRVRKDLLSLTPEELQMYRERLDDVLQVGTMPSKWQELGRLHAEWCLHYQEATFLWHRAFLRYAEELLGSPIPYWNGFAADTSDPASPHAGLPGVFLEETYTHSSGQVRPNPLKYALSCNGQNKMGTGTFVERYKELVDGTSNPGWQRKVKLMGKYHEQIASALNQTRFSMPEDSEGYPWANLPAFTDDQPDKLYPPGPKQFFDGLFEQAHDNYHGWVGPDMADNTYTAFDPVFLSYHANMDRIVEMYIRGGISQQYTSNFPLRPFTQAGTALAFDPSTYLYTTIGDMAKPTQALGYLYGPPATPDFVQIHKPVSMVRSHVAPRGGTALALVSNEGNNGLIDGAGRLSRTKDDLLPFVVFQGVACTTDSYQIDIFIKGAKSHAPDPSENAFFIGRVTHLGMGVGAGEAAGGLKNRDRCKKPTISRLLDASCAVQKLKEARAIEQVVVALPSGKRIEKEEWLRVPGMEGKLVWM